MKKILVIFCFFLSVSTFSQNNKFTFIYQAGMGKYQMHELKTYMTDYAKSLPFNAKLINAYPAFVYNQFSILHRIGESFHLGINYRYCSTGARLSFADYSGKYSMDNLLSMNTIGLISVIDIVKKKKFTLSISQSLLSNNSKVRFHEYATLNGINYEYKDAYFKSASTSFEIGVTAQKFLWRKTFLGLNAGYNYSTSGVIYIKNNHYALEMNNKTVSTNWSGLRIGLMLGVFL